MSRSRRRRTAAALALAALALSKGVAVSLFVPPFQAPDEPYHFDHVQALAEAGAAPRPDARCRAAPMFSPEVRAAVRELLQGVVFHPEVPVPPPARLSVPTSPGSRATTGCGPASIYPPVWYATAAVAYRAAYGATLLGRLLAVRWSSVAWSCLVAVAALWAGLLALGRLRDAVLYAMLVTLQPMAGVFAGVANSEVASLACSALALLAIARASRSAAPARTLVLLAGVLSVGVLGKPGFVLALPAFAALTALAVRRRARHPLALAAAVFAPAVAVAAAFALSGGERTGLYREIPTGGTLAQQLARHLAPGRLFDVWVEQYWGKLGWMDAQPGRGWYVALAAATVVAVAGVAAVRRHRTRELAIAGAVAAGTLVFVAALYGIAWRRGDLLWVEGRHVLVLFPAQAYVMARGLVALRRRLPRRVDPLAAFVVLVALADVAEAFAGARRFYGAPAWPALMRWQAAWDVPLLLPAAAVAAAITVLLLWWTTRPGRACGAGGLPASS